MKRIILALIVLIIYLLCQSIYVFSESEGTVSLQSDNPLINKGDYFVIKLYTENIEDIYGFHIKLSFDKNFIQPVNQSVALDNNITNKNHFVAVNTVDNKGTIELMITLLKDETPLNKNTLIAIINFKALKEGSTTVSVEKCKLLNKRGESIDYSIKEITLTVKEVMKRKNKSSPTDNIVLELPDNLSPEDFEISINENDSSNGLSNIYTIQSLYPLDCKLKLSIKLNKSINVKHPGIYYFNEERNKWIYLGGELKDNYISTSINRLGSFCVFENTNYKDYKDIDNSWAKEYIQRLTSMGIVKGVDENSFNPTGYVTRAEIAKIISLALDLNDKDSSIQFKDSTTIPHWAVNYINTIVASKIMIGYSDNEFKANKHITRAELAVILNRILKYKKSNSYSTLFTDDNKITDWSRDSIYEMKALGIMSGYEDNSFRPNFSVTRAEACKVIVKLLEIIEVI